MTRFLFTIICLFPLFLTAETIVVKTKAPQNRNAVFQSRVPKGYDRSRREMYRVLVIFGGRNTDGNDLERYTYDPAGNRLSKSVNGVTTTYTYDEANQLVTSTVNGVTTEYRYDAAGRWHQRSRRIFSSFYFTSQCNSRYSSDVYEPSVKFQVQLHFNT